MQIYVYDQSGQVPLLVRNKAAEILFANIIADDVSECYKSHMLLETSESGNLSAPGIIDSVGSKEITKRRKTEQKPNFHQIWLIMIKCLLNQGSNSPFCFQILVNPEKNVEDGRFELVSLTMPIPWDVNFFHKTWFSLIRFFLFHLEKQHGPLPRKVTCSFNRWSLADSLLCAAILLLC